MTWNLFMTPATGTVSRVKLKKAYGEPLTIRRARTSVEPPAGNGTILRTDRVG